MIFFNKNKVYLDYASFAPMPKAVKLLVSHLYKKGDILNSSSLHTLGISAKNLLENARLSIAEDIDAHKDEIIFTGSSTESIGLAILGVVYGAKEKYPLPHIITSNIEHSAVLETCKMLEDLKLASVTYLESFDSDGIIKPADILKALKPETVLVSIHLVNGEIGVVQPVSEYIKILNKTKEERYNLESIRFEKNPYYPYLHIDASQAYAHLDISNFIRKKIDLVSFNSSKIGGPSGVAGLFKRRGVILQGIYAGGEQEFGLRPGTTSPILCSGFANASKIIQENKTKNEAKYTELKEFLLKGLETVFTKHDLKFRENSNKLSIPSIVNISFPYFTGEQIMIELDAMGVFVSTKSACKNSNNKESEIIHHIYKNSPTDTDYYKGTIRISFGPNTTKRDINILLKSLNKIFKKYKNVLY